MEGLKIGDFQRGLVKVTGTQQKSLPFKPGEIIQAKVLSSADSGVVTLKINDTVVTVKTEIPLPKDSVIFFKVIGPDSGKADAELKLQLTGYARQEPAPSQPTTAADSGVKDLLLQASKLLTNKQEWASDFPHIIRQILKALPQDTSSLPKQTRVELLDVLKSSLKLTGQNIQENVNKLLQHLPESTELGGETGKLLKNLMVHIQKLSYVTLRDALENTGVTLETKLRAFLTNRAGGPQQQGASDSIVSGREPLSYPELGAEGKMTAVAQEIRGVALGAKLKAFLMNQASVDQQQSSTDSSAPGRTPPASIESEVQEAVASTAQKSTGAVAGTDVKPVPTSTAPESASLVSVPDSEQPLPKDPAAKAATEESSLRPPSARGDAPSDAALKAKAPLGAPADPGMVNKEAEPLPPSKAALEVKGELATANSAAQEADSTSPFQKDLKAVLTQLKTLFDEENRGLLDKLAEQSSVSGRTETHERLSPKELMNAIDGLLRDVETFQLLSKVTDSFYTFLPVVWDELKDGDIAFKKPRGGGNEDSYYCVINLNLERFGNLMIMVLMQQKEFFVSFKTGDPPLRSLLSAHTRELQAIFEETGIRLRGVNVLGSEDASLVPFERLDAFDSIISIKV
ncbi:MAG: hypothetical protein RBS57_02120 [Desulforhabdus sp.]|jgi:hypothetical protein|nr:hypothetical protein [Desulforhabdus sp.]